MINHIDLGKTVTERRKTVSSLIRKGIIVFGGYRKSKLYGLLSCSSGKRMKVENRVLFSSEAAARAAGYRPCAHCMRSKYEEWKVSK